jgi:4-aminobutyrate aminotransferase/(S)-3-amino-2-methylpropionate transaminase
MATNIGTADVVSVGPLQNTWMGDPIRALQAASQISVIKEHSLVEHTASVGDRLFGRLDELAKSAGAGKMSNLRGKGDGTFIAWDMPTPADRDTLLKDMRNLGVNMAGVSGVSVCTDRWT